MEDFPAAHSMDTVWFCVDECGHVAVCDSGESGAVPKAAARDLDLLHGARASAPLESIDPAHAARLARGFEDRHGLRGDSATGLLLLRDLPPGRPKAHRRLDRDLVLVALEECEPGWLEAVHRAGLCRSCRDWEFAAGACDSLGQPLARYQHESSDSRPCPYLLSYFPAEPVLLNRLPVPPAVRGEIAAVAVPGCFGERTFWQPAETHECDFWGRGWTALRPEGHEFERMLRQSHPYL